MEKQIRDAGKQSKIARKDKRRHVLTVPNTSSSGRKAVRQLPRIAQGTEQISEALGIVIPCRSAKGPDRITPIYITRTDSEGRVKGRWLCFWCRMSFKRRKPCCGHMGLIQDRPHHCSVLRKEDEDRRIRT